MILLTWVPLVLLAALTVAVSTISSKLHPAWAARTLAVLTLSTFGAIVAALLVTSATFLTQLMPHGATHSSVLLGLIAQHASVSWFVGFVAAACICTLAIRLVQSRRRFRRMLAALPTSATIVDDDPYAMAVPGRSPRIMVSSGLRRRLSREQLAVVYAHEHAHLHHRHHQYMAMTHFLVIALPPLSRVESAMRFHVERWADEEAAARVGSRRLVAETLALVALSQSRTPEAHTLGAADHQVTKRVQALLDDSTKDRVLEGRALFSGSGVLAAGLASSPLQAHHVLALALL